MMFGHDRSDRWESRCLRVGPGLGVEIPSLQNHIRLVIAELGIDRSNQCKTIEHRRLFGQMFADEHPRQGRRSDSKGASILDRAIRLGVPSIDLTRTTGHPQQNDALALGSTQPTLSDRLSSLDQSRKGQPGDTAKTRFEQISAAGTHQPLRLKRAEGPKGISMGMRAAVHRSKTPPKTIELSKTQYTPQNLRSRVFSTCP